MNLNSHELFEWHYITSGNTSRMLYINNVLSILSIVFSALKNATNSFISPVYDRWILFNMEISFPYERAIRFVHQDLSN